MSDLGPEARALIDDADGVDSPSAANRENVRARLAAQIGLAAGAVVVAKAGTTGASAKVGATLFGSGAALLAAKVLVGVVVAVGLTAGILASTSPDAPVVPPAPTLGVGNGSAPPAKTPAPETPNEAEVETPASPANAVAPPAPARTASRPSTMRPATDEAPAPANAPAAAPSAIAVEGEGEAALFHKAQAAIDSGNGAAALALLDRHEKLYPNGLLAGQRPVERILALCTVGRVPASRAAAERFLSEHPRSSKAAAVRAACGVP